MKITLVTAYYYPEISSVTHLYRDLAQEWSKAGHEVTVVTNVPVRGLTEEERRAWLDRLDETTPQGTRILRVGSRRPEGKGLAGRGLRFVGNSLALYRAARRVETDAYVVGSMPPYLGLAGAWLNRRAPSAFVLQDLFPDSLIQMGRLGPDSWLARVFYRMEKKSCSGNARLITISQDMKRTLLHKGVEESRLSVVPNWIDPESIQPVPRESNPLFEEYKLSRCGFYAVYAGTLGILQNPDILLDAAKLTPKEITYVLIGSGTLMEHLRQRLEREYIENVVLLPMQSVDRVSQVYSLGDVNLIPLKDGVTNIAFPSKTFTAMAAGRAVLATAPKGSGWEEMLLSSGGAAVCAPDDARSLCDGVRALYAKRESLPGMGRRAREYVVGHCDKTASAERYIQVLEQMVKERRA